MDFQSKDKRPDCCSPCRTVRDAEAVQREHKYIHCLSHCCVQVHFGSQFEGIVHHGGDRMATKAQSSRSHCVCSEEQREMDGGAQLAFSFSYCQEPMG